MSEKGLRSIPTTLVTGALGTGKTSVILSLLRHRPEREVWAVLVNEFGEMGLDGVVLKDAGVTARQIAGGCICCAAGPQLEATLVQLIREVRPNRIFIEPTGLAKPGTILDLMRRPNWREVLDPGATLCVVHPKHFRDPRHLRREIFHAQLQAADVIVANHTDQSTSLDLDAMRTHLGDLYPGPVEVLHTAFGALDDISVLHRKTALAREPDLAHHHAQAVALSWVVPPTVQFHRAALMRLLQDMVDPHAGGPLLERLKGIFHTPKAWVMVQAAHGQLRWSTTQHRRDSRLDLIYEGQAPRRQLIDTRLTRCIVEPSA